MAVRGHLWQGEGDGFLPGVFSLSDGPVTSVQTSPTDPRVGFDSSGLFVTDATGTKLVTVTPSGLLLAGTQGNPPTPSQRAISWFDPDTGAIESYITGLTEPGFSAPALRMMAGKPTADDTPNRAQIILAGGVSPALLSFVADNVETRIFDALNRSKFIQDTHGINTLRAIALAVGSATVNFPNNSASSVVTISHGLGRTPIAAFIIASNLTGVWWATSNYNSTSFQVQGSWSGVLNTNAPTVWLAVG